MIYDSRCLVLFYENFETNYKYTPLGKISNTAGLKETLGTDTVSVSFQTGNASETVQDSVNDNFFKNSNLE